jgi:DNA-binding XRE family transcriptional regulator
MFSHMSRETHSRGLNPPNDHAYVAFGGCTTALDFSNQFRGNYTYSPLTYLHQWLLFLFMDIQQKFGKTLRKLRDQKGLSQEKFSFVVNLDRTYIASIERGERNLSLNNIEKISKAFDLSLSEFFKMVEENAD